MNSISVSSFNDENLLLFSRSLIFFVCFFFVSNDILFVILLIQVSIRNQVSINDRETNLREEKQNLLEIIQTIGNKKQIIECMKEMLKIFPENYQDEHFTRFRDSIVRRNN